MSFSVNNKNRFSQKSFNRLPANQDPENRFKPERAISMHNTVFIIVSADIPDEIMPTIYNSFIATCRTNPIDPVILSEMDI
jgi:hypothetical protein